MSCLAELSLHFAIHSLDGEGDGRAAKKIQDEHPGKSRRREGAVNPRIPNFCKSIFVEGKLIF